MMRWAEYMMKTESWLLFKKGLQEHPQEPRGGHLRPFIGWGNKISPLWRMS